MEVAFGLRIVQDSGSEHFDPSVNLLGIIDLQHRFSESEYHCFVNLSG